jgi:hypothetical protein
MKHICIPLLFVNIASSCVSSPGYPEYVNNDTYILELDTAEERERILYSSMFDSIKIIPLSNKDEIIGQIDKISVSDDVIFVLDRRLAKTLLSFDLNGRLLCKFGKIGRGPGEYAEISDFTIDAKNQIVYVLDDITQSISSYDALTGKFIKKVRINEDETYSSYNIQYSNGYIYSDIYYDTYSSDNRLLQKIDIESGETINTYFTVEEYRRSYYHSELVDRNIFYCDYNNTPLFSMPFMDVFMALEDEEPVPYLYIHGTDIISHDETERMPREEGPEMYTHLSRLKKISHFFDYFQYGDDLHIRYQQGNIFKYLNFNQDSYTTTSVVFYFDDMLFKNRAYQWLPEFGCSTENGIYKYLDTNILSLVSEDSKNESLALDKANLDLLKTVSPESNPVILYYEFRE